MQKKRWYSNDNREYKWLSTIKKLKCTLCPPNKGCNTDWNNNNNWKEHRKTQWRGSSEGIN